MNELTPKQLRKACTARLSGASYSPRRLAFWHTLVIVGCNLALVLIDLLLTWLIGRYDGIAGMSMRSALETVRYILSVGVAFLLPFWEIGFLFAALHLAQDGNAEPSDLFEGFRRFGPVLRLMILEAVIFAGIAIATAYGSTFLYLMTPFSDKMVDQLLPIVEQMNVLNPQMPELTNEQYYATLQAMTPLFILWGVVFTAVALPVFYRLRMAKLSLLADDRRGALAAHHESRQIMKGRRLRLFRLDLHFFWYYLLLLLLEVVMNGEILMLIAGVEIHVLAYVGVYCVGFFLLMWLCRSRVQTTYALFYQAASEGEAGLPTELPEALPEG